MSQAKASQKAPAQTRVFISYSRRDGEFAARLAEALAARGYLADFDNSKHDPDNVTTGISAQDDWWKRLQEMIAAADVMVFAASPDSAKSAVCDEEIAFARAKGKRIVAILARPIDFANAPPRLAALNVKISFAEGTDFDASLAQLVAAIDKDVAWLREGTRLTLAAADWEAAGKRDDELLHGAEIGDAEAWSARRPASAPEISESLLAYFSASRAAEAVRLEKERRSLKRQRVMQRWIGGLVTIAMIITALGGWLVVSGQRTLAQSRSLMLSRVADQFYARQDFVRGLRLSVLAAKQNFLSPAAPEAMDSLAANAMVSTAAAEMRGHDGAISGAVLSRDESRLLTWGRDGTARLWDARSGAPIGAVMKHARTIEGAKFSSDERRVLTWSWDDTARVWNSATGAPITPPIKHGGPVRAADFTSDQKHIVTSSMDNAARFDDRVVRLWDAATGAQVGAPLNAPGAVWDLAAAARVGASPNWAGAKPLKDGRHALVESAEGIRVRDLVTGVDVGAAIPQRTVLATAVLSPDESRLLIGTQLWDLANRTPLGPPAVPAENNRRQAVFSKDGRLYLTWAIGNIRDESADGTVVMYNAQTGAAMGPLTAYASRVTGAVFSNDSSRFVTWSQDGSARLWSVRNGAQIGAAMQHDGAVRGAAFFSDDRRVLTWSEDGVARVWALPSGGEKIALPEKAGPVAALIVFKDGNRLMLLSRDEGARLWDMKAGAQIGRVMKGPDGLEGAALSTDETRVLTWRGGAVHLWDAATGAPVGAAHKLAANPEAVEFSADGARIVTVVEGVARVWNTADWTPASPELKRDYAINGAALSKDGARLLIAESAGVHVVDTATGKDIGAPLKQTEARGAMFWRDDERILTWGLEPVARIWNAATLAPIGVPLQHAEEVLGATLSRDESRILTWSYDRTARLWSAETGAPIGLPITHVGRPQQAALVGDEGRVLTWGDDGLMAWDTKWAAPQVDNNAFVRAVCEAKLSATNFDAPGVGEVSVTPSTGAGAEKPAPLKAGLRRLDAEDIRAAPILRGREGEDVCAPPPPFWEHLNFWKRQ